MGTQPTTTKKAVSSLQEGPGRLATETSLWPCPDRDSANVDTMKVVGPESSIALGTFALSGIVAGFHALKAENVEAFGEHGILLAHVTAGAGQASLQSGRQTVVRRGW